MSDPTRIYLPKDLPYPITITKLCINPGDSVARGDKLLEYSFTLRSKENPEQEPLLLFGSWDSPLEGKFSSWSIHIKEVITLERVSPNNSRNDVGEIEEKCKHQIQIAGLCAVCGEDVSGLVASGSSGPSNVGGLGSGGMVPATHLARGPVVSLEEAKRLGEESSQWLLNNRKLSLIVDLDQTVVHATVDPTVGEWISEGKLWEASLPPAVPGKKKKRSPPPPPNWPALKDVVSFRLAPEGLGMTPGSGGKKVVGPGAPGGEGCIYYIKPRPGWKEFLTSLSDLYELHVYTMGTRSYALSVLDVLDPDKKLFGSRVLSRDESGSLSTKSLRRLFPTDTSMVVVIDDRGDVWEWCENLVKVVPYDFFVGIGDINSAFLPKQVPLIASPFLGPDHLKDPSQAPRPLTPPTPLVAPGVDPIAVVGPDPDPETSESMMVKEQGKKLVEQMEDRPLAREQEKLSHSSSSSSSSVAGSSRAGSRETTPVASGSSGSGMASKHPHGATLPHEPSSSSVSEMDEDVEDEEDEISGGYEPALLRNDDTELGRVEGVLREVHRLYYEVYDLGKENGKGKGKMKGDVTTIIPGIRKRTFEGLHLLFSSVIPLDQDPERSEIWKMARSFGATCHSSLNEEVTHVVAAKPGTLKVDMARKKPWIKIVWMAWFIDSISLWVKQDEERYLLRESQRSEHITQETNVTVPPTEDDPGGVGEEMLDDFEEFDEEDDAMDGMDGGVVGEEELKPIAESTWDEANDEVDAAMMESDSEFGEATEDDDGANEGSPPSSPATGGLLTPKRPMRGTKRVRSRSATPSTPPSPTPNALTAEDLSDPNLASPLAKRKKLVDRRGNSMLRKAVVENSSVNGHAEEEDGEDALGDVDDANADSPKTASTPSGSGSGSADGEDLDEDFLAAELEKELG